MKQTSVSGTVSCASAGSITYSVAQKLCFRKCKPEITKKKVVRFSCIRSNGNARKRHETGNGNTGYPSCFRNGLTCFCHVSVYGFLQFRPVVFDVVSITNYLTEQF